MNCILALDQGTSSSRAILFDGQGQILGIAQQEFGQIFPRHDRVEHDPVEIWNSQRRVMEQVIRESSVAVTDIAAMGITNQRETTVVWDRKTGQPVYNAIVWQDRRTMDRCDEIRMAGHGEMIRQKTGLLLDAYFSGTKVQWILENVEGARQRADAGDLLFGTIDSWLVWNLTAGNVHVTDASNASRTLLFNIHHGDWDDELLDLLDIPRSMLPRVSASSEVVGTTADHVIPGGVPIAGIAGDQQAALFGQMCLNPGMVKNTYGTGCFMLMNCGTRPIDSKNGLLTTIAWRIGDATEYALEGSVYVAGAAVQWLRDGLGFFDTSAEIETLASGVADNGGVYFVPALTGLGAPHWDPRARGLVIGLTRGTTRGHFARATLEGIALQVMDVLNAMQIDADVQLSELKVDGGLASNNLLMQTQADLLGVPVIRPAVTETTALGAACLAGLATGFWNDPDEIARQQKTDRTFVPQMSPDEVQSLQRGWQRALDRSKGWIDA